MNDKTHEIYATSRSDYFTFSNEYCHEYTRDVIYQNLTVSIRNHYNSFMSYITKGYMNHLEHKKSYILNSIFDCKYHLHLHNLVVE